MKPDEPNAEIHDTAAAWVARVDRGLSPGEQQHLDTWLAADSRNAGAYVRAQAAWQLTSQSEVAGAALVEEKRFFANRRRALAWGAGAIAASAAAYFGVVRMTVPRYATDIGEVSQKSLADGSTVALDTASSIATRFDTSTRSVRLEHGQALFDVAKDAGRPFVVEAGPIRVKAVGTAFIVRRLEGAADVVVTEGVVSVWNVASPGKAIRLAAGQSALMANDETTPAEPHAMTAEQIGRRTAWRTGQIILSGETLGYAAAEFNRYNKDKIEIAGAGLAEKTLVGGFRTTDPEGFAAVVANVLDAKVEKSGNTITITR